jgi:hypothetical protein
MEGGETVNIRVEASGDIALPDGYRMRAGAETTRLEGHSA